MEWVSLILWAVIMALALPLGAGVIAQLAFGLQAVGVMTAFGLCVVFIAVGGRDWIAWAALACAVIAAVAVAIGAAWLTSSDRRVSPLGQRHEENLAALAGLELPLLVVGILINLSVALGMTVV